MLEGRLVRLRASEPADVPLLHQWFNDPEVVAHLALRYPLSLRDEENWINGLGQISYGNARNFAIETLADRRLVGGCGFHVTEPENRVAELGIAIGDKTAWDQGYGTDAMRVLCRFGFEEMNLHKIRLGVYAGNERARHVYEQVGFVVEARGREMVYRRGEWHDEYFMGLFREELTR